MSGICKIAVAGLGTVGGGVMKALAARQDELSLRAGKPIVVTATSARDGDAASLKCSIVVLSPRGPSAAAIPSASSSSTLRSPPSRV